MQGGASRDPLVRFVSGSTITDEPGIVYNSIRLENDKLDSSAINIQVQLSETYYAQFDRQLQKHMADGNQQRSAVQKACEEMVAAEILYWDHRVPHVWADEDHCMTPIRPPALTFELDGKPYVLNIGVERSFPLSSSHGGQPFIMLFAFMVEGGAGFPLFSTEFVVMAKKGKKGTAKKTVRRLKHNKVNDQRRWAFSVLSDCTQQPVELRAPNESIILTPQTEVAPVPPRQSSDLSMLSAARAVSHTQPIDGNIAAYRLQRMASSCQVPESEPDDEVTHGLNDDTSAGFWVSQAPPLASPFMVRMNSLAADDDITFTPRTLNHADLQRGISMQSDASGISSTPMATDQRAEFGLPVGTPGAGGTLHHSTSGSSTHSQGFTPHYTASASASVPGINAEHSGFGGSSSGPKRKVMEQPTGFAHPGNLSKGVGHTSPGGNNASAAAAPAISAHSAAAAAASTSVSGISATARGFATPVAQ